MARHKVYSAIVAGVRGGRLTEPFSQEDFRRACPGFAEGTYRTFLSKHRLGNPGGASELFEQVGRKRFRLVRPIRYGL